jgi:flagellar basal-body rod modification protein FlgD
MTTNATGAVTNSNAFAALNPASTPAQQSTGASNQLDQNSFLQLMITEFKNQDPSQPADPSQMLSQLAQFSTVTGIQGMQNSISGLTNSLMSSQLLNGATIVGHQVLAPQSNLSLASNQTVNGAVDVPTGVSAVSIAITDASGQVVRQITIPSQSGLTNFSWDGLEDNGAAAPPGNYGISAVGNVAGQNQSLQTLIASRVNSVTIDPTTQGLTLNTDTIGSIALSAVRQIM